MVTMFQKKNIQCNFLDRIHPEEKPAKGYCAPAGVGVNCTAKYQSSNL